MKLRCYYKYFDRFSISMPERANEQSSMENVLESLIKICFTEHNWAIEQNNIGMLRKKKLIFVYFEKAKLG